MARTWTQQEMWQRLSPTQKAAAMAIMEADVKNGRTDMSAAGNVLGAIINRSEKTGQELGQHVSQPIYQPTIEMSQFARLPRILQSPEFQELTARADRRMKGEEGDWVQGATHFLAPEKTMLALESREPGKYKNWGPRGANWTGYDEGTGQYRGVIMRDGSHAFLAPEGAHNARPADPFAGRQPVMAADGMTDARTPEEASQVTAAMARPQLAPEAHEPPTSMIATGTVATPKIGTAAAPSDPDSALLFASSFFDKQANDQAESQQKLARAGAEASAAVPKLPGASPMINGPRLPRVDMRDLLAVLKGSGVNPDMAGNLGTGGGRLGTRRA